jgi:hypothetical protein
LERIADSNAQTSFVFVTFFIVILFMQRLTDHFFTVLNIPKETGLPDHWFGYTEEQLYDWYELIGKDGCALYKNVYRFDLFPFMEAYSIALGVIMVQCCRQAGVSTQFAMIFMLTLWFDFLETVIPAIGCEQYPERLPNIAIQIAIGSNQLKWMTMGIGMIILTALFLYGSFIKSAVETIPPEKSESAAETELETVTDSKQAKSKRKANSSKAKSN